MGHRHLPDRREHLRGADHRDVRIRLRDRLGDRLVRMDVGAHADHRRQVLPADLPEEQHLHDARVPRAALQSHGPHRHGGLLARRLRIRQPDGDPLAGRHGGAHRHRHQPGDRVDRAGRVRRRLRAVRRPEGSGPHGHRAGLTAGTRRPHHQLHRPREDLGWRRHRRRLPRADSALSRQISDDPAAQQSELQGPARAVGPARRHVGDERLLLGIQSIHHPAGTGRP